MRHGNLDPKETEGIGSRSLENGVILYCPIPSDSILPHSKITHVEIHGWGSSLCQPEPRPDCPGFVIAFICVSFANSADGECTFFKRGEVRGSNYMIEFKDTELWPWTRDLFGYPYVEVQLPQTSWNGDTNTLRGITVSGRR
jgi:hypothetical protein